MAAKKAVFFDIDGTLWNHERYIPPSTVQAIQTLRKNGHLAFINSGRSRSFIFDESLLGIGFDGIVSGCGSRIEYRGEILSNHTIDRDLAIWTVELFLKYGFRPILEGHDYLYLNPEDFLEDAYGQRLQREMGDGLRYIKDTWGEWDDLCKYSCLIRPEYKDAVTEQLSPYYYAMVHNDRVAEYAPLGLTKGTGITELCSLLDIDLADTIAIGDSINDMEMIKTAGLGIAMGDGRDALKEVAGFVTAPFQEEGIYKACVHCGLL